MSDQEYEDVREDGTIEDPYQNVETYFCPLLSAGETEDFLRVIGDNGMTNVEIRIPLDVMQGNGWTPPGKSVSERLSQASHLEADNAALLAACKSIVAGANELYARWDKDKFNYSHAGKYLAALAGYNKGYRLDCDKLHQAIAQAEQRQPEANR